MSGPQDVGRQASSGLPFPSRQPTRQRRAMSNRVWLIAGHGRHRATAGTYWLSGASTVMISQSNRTGSAIVSKATLFPVLMPLAPAATLLKRFPDHLAQALVAHDAPQTLTTEELAQMPDARLAPAESRKVLGIMNGFTSMAESSRSDSMDFDPTNLTALAGRLAGTPCSLCSSGTPVLTANCGRSCSKQVTECDALKRRRAVGRRHERVGRFAADEDVSTPPVRVGRTPGLGSAWPAERLQGVGVR
jgi:hypothetical protein